MDFLTNLESWVTHSAWPTIKTFFGGVVASEVAAVQPLATQAVAELTAEEAAAVVSGNTANTGHILAAIVKNTTQKMEAAAVTAGANSILTAVGAAVAATKPVS